jgi:alkylated DNA nucleotide flippase Atl1
MTENTGTVAQLFCKLSRGAAVVQSSQVLLKAGLGIDRDIHAHRLSPRQVLVVRAEDLLELSIAPGQLSENIVISGIGADQFVPGARLEFASGAVVRLTFYCEPCKRIGHLVSSLEAIAQKRGILGVVVRDGLVSVDAKVKVETHAFPPLSEVPYERFLEFLLKIPAGKVVTYQTVIIGIGVDRSYFRALPGYLRKADAAGYPAYKVLDSKGYLIPHVVDQGDQLMAENIEINYESASASVLLERYSWEGLAN